MRLDKKRKQDDEDGRLMEESRNAILKKPRI